VKPDWSVFIALALVVISFTAYIMGRVEDAQLVGLFAVVFAVLSLRK
jgi:hypothetical protein